VPEQKEAALTGRVSAANGSLLSRSVQTWIGLPDLTGMNPNDYIILNQQNSCQSGASAHNLFAGLFTVLS
jgi:hypothetical protein